ncbi:hypothetical protein [Streptomyces parvus]|uniref:Flavodoxin family protein n=1 Tax=Streptomyces parvus TaxID=66428 RepID=A0A7K3S0E0_9ACTN|nr:hypothetical protein [Streptomyces parvus]NEC20964.1 hypothetical protein [Streptomyces parvus]
MKAVIVCVPVSHGNTLRVADAMAQPLGAGIVSPEEADPRELAAADLTWAPFKLVGGLNRHRPNTDDLAAARAFAERLRDARRVTR